MKSLFWRRRIWRGDRNGVVLNHGDTFSTLLGSLLAKLLGLKNAHIESGLRSFRLFHPFPEEITRILVFFLSDYYMVPNAVALKNIARRSGHKLNTEVNTLYDTLRFYREHASDFSGVSHEAMVAGVGFSKFGLVSLHRYENIFKADRLHLIVDLLEKIARKSPLVFILHKPTEKKLKEFGLLERLEQNKNIELHPRYDYFSFIELLNASSFLISDGGSNQEECYYIGHPCLLMRHATERHEGLGENAVLSRFDEAVITEFIENIENYKRPALRLDNSPSKKIVDDLEQYA